MIQTTLYTEINIWSPMLPNKEMCENKHNSYQKIVWNEI